MDDAKLKEIISLLVDGIKTVNQRADSAYMYIREVDLALQRLLAKNLFPSEFWAELQQIHGNEEIPEVALVKQQHDASQRSLSRAVELLKQ